MYRNPEFLSRVQHEIVLHRVVDCTEYHLPGTSPSPEQQLPGSVRARVLQRAGRRNPRSLTGRTPRPAASTSALTRRTLGRLQGSAGEERAAHSRGLARPSPVTRERSYQIAFFFTPQILIRNLRFYRNCLIR